ncbi:MAG: rod shape-determining protein RodA [Ignavibacteriales bacterium]
MKVNYNLQDRFDFFIFIPLLVLIFLGLTGIYSSTVNHPTANGNFERQFIWAIISLIFFFSIYIAPSQLFKTLSMPSYAVSILLLVFVLLIGKTVYGSKSWLSFGFIGFQPSEFAKVGTILFLSKIMSEDNFDINDPKTLLKCLGIGMLPIFLILLEPDMGTTMVFMVIILFMLFWRGLSLFGLFVVLSPGIVLFASLFGKIISVFVLIIILLMLLLFKRNIFTSVAVAAMNIGAGFVFDIVYKFLKPHQQRRIDTFLDPMADPLGSGYNALQAKVAIGSGGFLGKGFMNGNQTQLRFIPKQWTDFIFSVIGEEFGFIGSVIVLLMFLIIFIRLLNLSKQTNDSFGSLVTIGAFALLFAHFAINIGMNLGITPVVGLPLPFFSYGGSSLLVNVIMMAILMNFYKNRRLYD